MGGTAARITHPTHLNQLPHGREDLKVVHGQSAADILHGSGAVHQGHGHALHGAQVAAYSCCPRHVLHHGHGQVRDDGADAAPLVHATHPLHEQALVGLFDGPAPFHGLELHHEAPFGPAEQGIDGVLAPGIPILRVDDFTLAEVNGAAPIPFAGELSYPRLAPHLHGLDEIHHGHIGQVPLESCLSFPVREDLALLLLQHHLDPDHQLLDEYRLGQVLLNAQLQATDLLLECFLLGEEDEGEPLPAGVILEPLTELIAINSRQPGVGDDQRRAPIYYAVQSVLAALGGDHGVARLAQAHLKDA